MIASLDLRPSSARPVPPVGSVRRGGVARVPACMLLGLIRLYQRTLSPILPVLTLGTCGCRFSPTCSHYAAEAIQTHGAFTGASLAVRRLLKCTPLHPGGLDPVPARVCSRVTL